MQTPCSPATPAPCEFARYGVTGATHSLEALHARFERHRFTAHAHVTRAIGGVLHGAKNISASQSKAIQVTEHCLYTIPPGEIHAGTVLGAQPCEYVMLYLSEDEWQVQCSRFGVAPEAWSMHPAASLSSVTLLRSLVMRLTQCSTSDPFNADEWTHFCDAFFGASECVSRALPQNLSIPSRPDRRIVRAAEFLHDCWNEHVSLQMLADDVAMSAFDLCRQFGAAYGLTPHRYQIVLRVMQAKSRLLKGEKIADVAAFAGFADQSHLGRHLKSVLGTTPKTLLDAATRARG